MSRLLAWALLALTCVLVPVAVVLAVVAASRDLPTPDGWESGLLLAGVGGAVALLFAVVGVLIARAEPRNAIGWILLGAGTTLASLIAALCYADLVFYGGERWPAARWGAWFANWSFIPAVFVTPAIVAQLFPDGRPLPGRWRYVLWASIAVAVQAVVASALDPTALDPYPGQSNPVAVPEAVASVARDVNQNSGVVLAPPLFIISLASLVVRFRRSRQVERQQMKWLVFAGAVPVTLFSLSFVWGALVGESALLDVLFLTGFATLMLIPLAVGTAILRYRLYEIDRVISKALVYGALTVLLGAAYVGLVLAAQAVFSSLAGGSNLAIAASTLVVAALFLPARGRVQRFVDRRFYRRRYDAQRTLEAFGTRLRSRLELDGLRVDLEQVVGETIQPAHVSVWVRGGRP